MLEKYILLSEFFEKEDFPKKEIVTNFFSIGTRGFYENPFTDIISYILDTKTEYNYRSEFLNILLKNNVDGAVIKSVAENGKIQKQCSTINGNYIDLIIYNDKYIIVFENKINHWLANPFEDYIFDINTKYQNLQKIFIVFSYKKEDCPENWININIKEKFNDLRKELPHKYDNKWDYFVNDFLIQFSDNKTNMEQNEFEFYSKNFTKIIEANDGLTEYFRTIGDNLKNTNQLSSYRISDNWSRIERAIRLYPFNDDNNITIIFNQDSKFSISLYYYKNFVEFHKEIHNLIGIEEYRIWKEGGFFCASRLPGKEFKQIEEAISESQKQIEIMKKYYG